MVMGDVGGDGEKVKLERIGHTLAGLDLGDRRRRTAVDLALVSWRLRTAAASYRR